MGLKPRDIVVLMAVTVLFSPVAYFLILLMTDNARIEFGAREKIEKVKEELKVLKPSPLKDSLLAQYSKTFLAMQQERADIAKQREQLQEEQSRVDMVQKELESQKDSLTKERQRMEQLVKQSDELESKRIKQLSRVYAAMRPAEAAQILETLDDNLAGKIVNYIADERQKAKIMSALSKEKAARISSISAGGGR
jgi:flagellar motility protein MotE (MotC chaperone)